MHLKLDSNCSRLPPCSRQIRRHSSAIHRLACVGSLRRAKLANRLAEFSACPFHFYTSSAHKSRAFANSRVPICDGSSLMSVRSLVVFDFDHTVVDGNTDTWIVKLLPDGIPQHIKDSYKEGGWTEYMGRVLEYMHQQGVSAAALKAQLTAMNLTPGMKDLLDELQQASSVDSIIVSDSNELFIRWILEHMSLSHMFDSVYTNPAAECAEGRVHVQEHHSHSCSICPRNLCKTTVLTDYISKKTLQGITYSRIAYVGDGSNDLCPCISLKASDLAFPRIDFALERQLSQKAPVCSVHSWSDARTIWQVLAQHVATGPAEH